MIIILIFEINELNVIEIMETKILKQNILDKIFSIFLLLKHALYAIKIMENELSQNIYLNFRS